MELVRDTPFEVGWFTWPAAPGRHALTVVVKATFELVTEGTAALAERQALLTGDEHHDDDVEQSVRYDSDLAPFKPRGECLLVGSCYAPGGRPASSLAVSLRVGPVRKSMAVVGNRTWTPSGEPSPPVPFTRMPLAWERCFGGRAFESNPVGRGIEPVVAEGKERILLPNVENPHELVASRRDRPAPHGAWPLPRSWPARRRLAGTYDARWLASRWPGLAADFDGGHFLASPEDQRIDGFWRGDERIVLHNLDPEHAQIDCRLPDLRARAFLRLPPSEPQEVELHCDTIVVDSDGRAAYVLWRGTRPIVEAGIDERAELFVFHEPRRAPLGTDEVARKLAAAQAAVLPVPAVEALPESSATVAAIPAAPPEEALAMRQQVERALAERASCAGWMLAGADLSQLDLSGADFGGAILVGARLVASCCDGAVMDGAVLAAATLDGASFRNASLARADLAGATGRDVVFEDARLDELLAADARLPGARFVGSSLVRADLARAELTGARFERVDLTGTDLAAARLDDAVFVESCLVEVSLEGGARAGRARFDGCDLTLLRASEGAELGAASLRGVSASGARFGRSRLDGADLSEAVLDRADFSDASLVGATLKQCRLRGACFRGAQLRQARLLKADLFEASLEGADLGEADLRGANLYAAEVYRAELHGARLDGANVEGTKLA